MGISTTCFGWNPVIGTLINIPFEHEMRFSDVSVRVLVVESECLDKSLWEIFELDSSQTETFFCNFIGTGIYLH